VTFSEVDVSVDVAKAREMVAKSGQYGVPVLDIDGQVVVGFDRERINALLGIA
jgi:glutaredoxin